MDLQLLIAQWTGALPPGFVRPAILDTGLATCQHKRCKNKVAIEADGAPAKACRRRLERRAASCRRRRAHFVAQGGCRRCAHRERVKGDFLCERRREDREIERAEAPGQPRRRHHRRVRRKARQGAPREQPEPRRLAVERPAEAGALGGLLVAAAGSTAEGDRGMAALDQRRGLALPLLLIPPSRSTRGGSGRRASASAHFPNPPAPVTGGAPVARVRPSSRPASPPRGLDRVLHHFTFQPEPPRDLDQRAGRRTDHFDHIEPGFPRRPCPGPVGGPPSRPVPAASTSSTHPSDWSPAPPPRRAPTAAPRPRQADRGCACCTESATGFATPRLWSPCTPIRWLLR